MDENAKRRLVDLQRYWHNRGIKLYMYPYHDSLKLELLYIPPSRRNQGLGTEVMQSVINFADTEGVPIQLIASEDQGSSLAMLKYFYGKFEFRRLYNLNDCDILMSRQPSIEPILSYNNEQERE